MTQKTCVSCKWFKMVKHFRKGYGECEYPVPDAMYDSHKDGIEDAHTGCPCHTEPKQSIDAAIKKVIEEFRAIEYRMNEEPAPLTGDLYEALEDLNTLADVG